MLICILLIFITVLVKVYNTKDFWWIVLLSIMSLIPLIYSYYLFIKEIKKHE